MAKKIISVITVVIMLFSVMATSFSTSAVFENGIPYGDIDDSGAVDTQDAGLALKIAAGLESITDEDMLERADVNNDGVVTLFDARQILRCAAGIIVSLQPSGAFSGFTGYEDDVFKVTSPEAAIAVFNTCLNKVKTEYPGFTRSESAEVINFHIDEVIFAGIGFGNSAESVSNMIKDMIVSESEPEEAQIITKGTNSHNAMSVEGEDYVSRLSANDVFGVEVSYDGAGLMTIKVALPDCEIENISQTAYADLFNVEIIQEDSESVLESVFAANTLEDAKRKNVRNAVATLVLDTETANVVSYTTTYETDMYLVNSTILSAELRGVQYGTRVSVTYDNFQW